MCVTLAKAHRLLLATYNGQSALHNVDLALALCCHHRRRLGPYCNVTVALLGKAAACFLSHGRHVALISRTKDPRGEEKTQGSLDRSTGVGVAFVSIILATGLWMLRTSTASRLLLPFDVEGFRDGGLLATTHAYVLSFPSCIDAPHLTATCPGSLGKRSTPYPSLRSPISDYLHWTHNRKCYRFRQNAWLLRSIALCSRRCRHNPPVILAWWKCITSTARLPHFAIHHSTQSQFFWLSTVTSPPCDFNTDLVADVDYASDVKHNQGLMTKEWLVKHTGARARSS
ncbi:unnamed protein product [Cyclocybe aegerita]|uniref:Uncharacterized protein n=1 Tax=Cyclocybe aegerita TaxID=1973307 RepID=A0A8S0XY59_CYCAE|nr:unnamed protein product [Cyclocybe aegerita]